MFLLWCKKLEVFGINLGCNFMKTEVAPETQEFIFIIFEAIYFENILLLARMDTKMRKSYNVNYNCCIFGTLYRHNNYFLYIFFILIVCLCISLCGPRFCQILLCTHFNFSCDLKKTCKRQTHVGRGSLLVLGDTALQVEGQVVTADQNPLPKLLLELPHVRLDAGEIQFLPDEGDVLKYSLLVL